MACKIIWVRMYDFPFGGAPQNRTISLAKGLLAYGNKVEIHLYGPGRIDVPLNKIKKQSYQGIEINNHSYKFIPATNIIKKIAGIAIGLPISIMRIISSNIQEPIKYIILGNNSNIYSLFFFLLSRFIGARLVRELNEYPPYEINKNYGIKLWNNFHKNTNFKWFDDFIIMTKPLLKYYSNLSRKNARFILIPMTFDVDRFKDIKPLQNKSMIVTYCGDLSQQKDGIFLLINSFAIVKQKYPNILLKIIGDNKDKKHMNNIQNIVHSLKLESNIIFLGYVSPIDIPFLLSQSSLLVLCRPSSKQAEGGFPTKLGEYLATGVPVVVTDVGEISLYLEDNVSAFISQPNNIVSFAASMLRALDNYEHAKIVGIQGREVSMRCFSNLVQGKRLSDFFAIRGQK